VVVKAAQTRIADEHGAASIERGDNDCGAQATQPPDAAEASEETRVTDGFGRRQHRDPGEVQPPRPRVAGRPREVALCHQVTEFPDVLLLLAALPNQQSLVTELGMELRRSPFDDRREIARDGQPVLQRSERGGQLGQPASRALDERHVLTRVLADDSVLRPAELRRISARQIAQTIGPSFGNQISGLTAMGHRQVRAGARPLQLPANVFGQAGLAILVR
jgi:hypothetical protein